MTSLVLAVDLHNTVQETLSIRGKHVIRQVIISSHSAMLGMVSWDDIFEKDPHGYSVNSAHSDQGHSGLHDQPQGRSIYKRYQHS
ncbi:MAG TPA: hypothetical protein VE692_06375 [Nitrososphaera sp.]|nr:hypothetical protein [Nitrososphaera sp.]